MIEAARRWRLARHAAILRRENRARIAAGKMPFPISLAGEAALTELDADRARKRALQLSRIP